MFMIFGLMIFVVFVVVIVVGGILNILIPIIHAIMMAIADLIVKTWNTFIGGKNNEN